MIFHAAFPRKERIGTDGIIHYRNDDVIERYVDEYKSSAEEAEQAFIAVKQFLYTSFTVAGSHAPSRKIDEMWHNFILFTRDYRIFCERNFGVFIDHSPTKGTADMSAYNRTRANAERIFGNLNESMWPDFSITKVGKNVAAACSGRPVPCNAPGQCNPKCNPTCNPVPIP